MAQTSDAMALPLVGFCGSQPSGGGGGGAPGGPKA
jgi:hypothetical protein